jgi:hypothetical protein
MLIEDVIIVAGSIVGIEEILERGIMRQVIVRSELASSHQPALSSSNRTVICVGLERVFEELVGQFGNNSWAVLEFLV